MAKINDGTLKDWKDGDKVTADLYEADREIIRVAINDTDSKTNTNTTTLTDHTKRITDLEYDVTGTVVPMTFKQLGMTNLTFDDIKLGYVDKQIEKAWQPMFDSFVKGVSEDFTATDGQTIFKTTNAYTTGTSQIMVEVDGVPQANSSFTETDSHTVTLSEPLVVGQKVRVTIGKVQPNADARFDTLSSSLAESAKKTDYQYVNSPVTDGVVDNSSEIQAAVNAAGANGKVYLPRPTTAYRIQTPIILKDGQIIEAYPNTTIYDYTNDYAFKVVGGAGFATQALKRVKLKNMVFVGSATPLGAIKLVNTFVVDLENIYAYNYSNALAQVLYIEDFFQVNFKTVHIYANRYGTGVYVNAVTGNSGQLNMYNTMIQRNNIGLDIIGTSNLIDGVIMYGGAIGDNYSKGLRIGKNVNNFVAIGTHIENHSGNLLTGEPMNFGDTAVDMQVTGGTANGINFYGCYFINNKYGIKSNNTTRVSLIGSEFDGQSISGNVAITQGTGDTTWFIAPTQIINYTTDVITAGNFHTDMRAFALNGTNLQLTRTGLGIYTGSSSPEGVVTAPVGSIYLRNDGSTGTVVYSKKSGTGNTGWQTLAQQNTVFTTAGRPAASTIGNGSQIYDSDLQLPLWSNGSSWKDAAGTVR
jgi:hypothetical protein